MKRRLLKLYWGLFGYPELPPITLITLEPKFNELTNRFYYPKYYSKYVIPYLMGFSIESIAAHNNVTRERVRQCLWKAYREGNGIS